MALRTIRVEGDPVLTKISRQVDKMTPRIHDLITDMLDTMYEAMGVGLAAPQVGCCRRFFIMHLGDMRIEAINPEIIKKSGKQRVLEGCLSVPNQWGYVTRPNKFKLRAQDRNGNWYEMTLTALGAQCTCHEYAHLDGQLFTDVVEEFVKPEDLEEA